MTGLVATRLDDAAIAPGGRAGKAAVAQCFCDPGFESPVPILAVGGELKARACVFAGRRITFGGQLGDLIDPATYRRFIGEIGRLETQSGFEPTVVSHDLHPGFLSTRYARDLGLPTIAVQHHHAHIASVMAEWGATGPVIGVAADGVGYGSDGAAWGCEIFRSGLASSERIGHLKYFPLVGGDAAAIEAWRPAAALLAQSLGPDWIRKAGKAFDGPVRRGLGVFERQMQAGVNSIPTSSLGRVFDAASFLLGLCDRNEHEAQAAIALEASASTSGGENMPYPYEVAYQGGCSEMDLGPAFAAMVRDRRRGAAAGRMAARFHETVSKMLTDAAMSACRRFSLDTVALSGGCFANAILMDRMEQLLESAGIRVLLNRRVSCGDAGLCLGQAVSAAAKLGAARLGEAT